MRFRSVFGVTTFLAAFVLNPAYFAGCAMDSHTPGFRYGAKEMTTFAKAAGDSFEFEDGDTKYRVDLAVKPTGTAKQANNDSALFASRAYACGDRRLTPTASACIDSSSMDVEGTMALTRLGDTEDDDEIIVEDVDVHGTLFVFSLTLSGGELHLDYDRGGIDLQSIDGKSFTLARFNGQKLGTEKVSVAVAFD